MSCSICGKGTGPGAMLCRPCKAALKRARQFTVQALPGTPIAVTGPGDAFPLLAPSRPARRDAPADRRRRTALAALALALFAAAAFVGGRGLAAADAERQAPLLAALAVRPALPPPNLAVPLPDLLPPPRAAASPPSRRPVPTPPLQADASAAAAPTVSAVPPPTALALAPEARTPTAPAAASPAPDRWQTVNEALARCAEEGGLSGFFCDQRVRLDACDGYWGRVAQCPAPSLPANPR